MPSSEIPPKSKGFGNSFEQIVLEIVVGLFLALGVACIAYPVFYYHHHPRPRWPIHPVASSGWAASSLAYSCFAATTAFFGFLADTVQPVVRPGKFQDYVVALLVV
jgi:hypothetical protein